MGTTNGLSGSETCAFHDRFDWVGDVEPGEIVTIQGEEATTVPFAAPDPRPCMLECLELRFACQSRLFEEYL